MSESKRCEACQVPEGLTCTATPAMCVRAAKPGEGAFRARLVENAKIRAQQTTQSSVIPCGESLALTVKMKACLYWVARSDCGCGVNECRAGKGKAGLVSHADCFECLQAGSPNQEAEPIIPSASEAEGAPSS